MDVVFLTNYFNHHQKYISEEVSKIVSSFLFVATSAMREERKLLGYGDIAVPDYVAELKHDEKGVAESAETCDVVIWGSAPYKLIKNRIHKGKLVFRYSERPLKEKVFPWKNIVRFVKWHIQNPTSKPIYLLAASAYSAWDFSKFGLYRGKAYRWGYFPETKVYASAEELVKQKETARILWCGRFLEWKHPDDVIRVAKRLKEAGYLFVLEMIGMGPMEAELKRMVCDFELKDHVVFTGAMKPEKVRLHMERAGIYLFTSDKREGWGAVLNESMNSGCAVVASHAIGSVPFLVQDNKNGMVYQSGNVDMMYEKAKYLLENPDEQIRMGQAAYRTITETWNAKVAAERLVNLAQHILAGDKNPDLYRDGPCSRAEIIKDDWFNE